MINCPPYPIVGECFTVRILTGARPRVHSFIVPYPMYDARRSQGKVKMPALQHSIFAYL